MIYLKINTLLERLYDFREDFRFFKIGLTFFFPLNGKDQWVKVKVRVFFV